MSVSSWKGLVPVENGEKSIANAPMNRSSLGGHSASVCVDPTATHAAPSFLPVCVTFMATDPLRGGFVAERDRVRADHELPRRAPVIAGGTLP